MERNIMKKALNKLLASWVHANVFAAIFIATNMLLATLGVETVFSEHVLSAHSLAEKWQQGVSVYLSFLLAAFGFFLLCNLHGLFKNKFRLMIIGALCGLMVLPITVLIEFLLNGIAINFSTLFLVISLPLLLHISLSVPLILVIFASLLSSLLFYGYQKLFRSRATVSLPELAS